MNHKAKVKLARKLQTRGDRKHVKLVHPLGAGFAIMRFFGCSGWIQRKNAIKARVAKKSVKKAK